jgi:hypothetical protein
MQFLVVRDYMKSFGCYDRERNHECDCETMKDLTHNFMKRLDPSSCWGNCIGSQKRQ